MMTASELRKYLETGLGGPTNDEEYSIQKVSERGSSDVVASKYDLDIWVRGESSAHNSVKRHLFTIGRRLTVKYVAEQLQGAGSVGEFAFATRCLAEELPFCIRVHRRFPGNLQMVSMENMAAALNQVIVAGWQDRAELHARLALKHYPDLFSDGVGSSEHPNFLLRLVNDWLETDLAIDGPYLRSELYHSTRHQGSEVYQELLATWRDPDPRRFDKALSTAADYHIAQSRNDTDFVNDKGETDERHFEFISMAYWLFPIELLAVLRLREWNGLRNPEPPSHPLFSASMLGKMPEGVPEWPRDKLVDAVEEKFATILPELPPLPTLADLPRLRLEQSRPAGRG